MESKTIWLVFQRLVLKYQPLITLGLIFALGMWLLVWRPIGYRFSIIPGLFGDTRLINYILEHFYLNWPAVLGPGYWNAGLYYPFPLALAFSDNLLGAGPFYALFRAAGLDRESALQGWLMLGFALNFLTAAWVLRRLKFGAFAAGLGAFFFTFGLPMMAQLIHAQLLYRFCVPLAAYLLWRFAERPNLARLAGVALLLLWQALIGIYLGVFLGLLLAALATAIAITQPGGWRVKLGFWPGTIYEAYQQPDQAAGKPRNHLFLALAALVLLVGGLAALFAPYLAVTRLYGFTRDWNEVTSMLPYPQSYLVADHAGYWQSISPAVQGMRMRHEHQLFFGLSALGLLAAGAWGGLTGRFSADNRRLALIHLGVLLALALLTVQVGGVSLYRLVWLVPGMDSIRSVTRIVLVLMWPAAVGVAYGADGLLAAACSWAGSLAGRGRLLPALASLLLAGLLLSAMLFESFSFDYRQKFAKRHAQERLTELRALLPAELPEDPILFVGVQGEEDEEMAEIDGMLLAQELGWPTLNGYSGNEPPGFGKPATCRELPNRIVQFIAFAQAHPRDFPSVPSYQALMARVVPIGFTDCDPGWWEEEPE